MKTIILKNGKEKPVLNRHPWIFSGAIARRDPGIEDGQIIEIHDWQGSQLGYGYYNTRSQITVRMLSFGPQPVNRAFMGALIEHARRKRDSCLLSQTTNAFRVLFSESDFFPGLLVDKYDTHLVVQILTLGIERLKTEIIELLRELLAPESIYERSDHAGRAVEGLEEHIGPCYGDTPDDIQIHENDILFHVDVKHGQKTGFFLDQRDNRKLVKDLSRGRKVLDLFCYSGGFSMAALCGEADQVISVDASESALAMAGRNALLNNASQSHICVCRDIFEYLRTEEIGSDLIIIDPPALAKTRDGVSRACRGYKDINLQAIKKCPRGSLVLTCSCSRFVSMDLFRKVVFAAAADAGRNASILRMAHHPADHPVSIFHPESEYLKSILLYIE